MEQINEFGKVAGSLSAILGLLALLLFNPIKNHVKKKREERRKAQEEDAAFRKEMREALGKINETLSLLTDDIGDLQYERLSQAHEYYTDQGWCPGSKKEMLCQMHKSYRAKNRNHLSEHYEEEIMRLDSKPHTQQS
ncbi:MAG: hypothetical protein J6B91_09445 [Prevotella sp.]|nr:hypothetical protein [Prevotella sp.]